MTSVMRETTLQTLGLGRVIDILRKGALPASRDDLVDQVFGKAPDRGALVISGGNGIVGAGKAMQLGSRLMKYDIPIVALDLPGAPDGLGAQYAGLVPAFGKKAADRIMGSIIQMSYDGKSLPGELAALRPRFLLEAIPEILSLKKAHYEVFRQSFPEVEIRSVTSGFPQSELGVGIAHPAFPHQINKMWEIVEPEPSAITQLLWSLGLIPVMVEDRWSFVLDVLFCGLTQAAVRYHEATNMPFWKIDKFTRKLLGPNPMRAHDAIGARGANFLTWSCLHHLGQQYGDLFTPSPSMEAHRQSGQGWYPMNHFRPLVNWELTDEEQEDFEAWLQGSLFQMTALMIHEKRSHLAQMNAIGELCAQFRKGVPAAMRNAGADRILSLVGRYHQLHPEAAGAWHPEALELMGSPEWQQLYVNAEHNGEAGVITISRESYSAEVDEELNRALDWLRAEGIEKVVLTGDFHLSTQMVGAETTDFFPALEDSARGVEIALSWSKTARRLHEEFATSVGLITGKRCLGGFLELMMHCHYLVALEGVQLGMPEVTLPVVPGMEGCHWSFRKSAPEHHDRLYRLLLEGGFVKAPDALGWLTDFTGSMEECLSTAWKIVTGGDHGLVKREVKEEALSGAGENLPDLAPARTPHSEGGRRAIVETIRSSCKVSLAEALEIQARHSGAFMTSRECLGGVVGTAFTKTMKV